MFGGTSAAKDTRPFEEVLREFEDFFNMDSKRTSKMNTQTQKGSLKGKDVHAKVELEFMDAVRGISTSVNVKRQVQCSECKGSKVKPNAAKHTCGACHGKGTKTENIQGNIIEVECQQCWGLGEFKQGCSQCAGNGLELVDINEHVAVPKGVEDDSCLRMSGKGH